jgi:hypothetical protein
LGRDRRRVDRPTRRRNPRLGGRRKYDAPAEWVSVTEYAARHSVHRTTVYKWRDLGLLECYQVENVVRIRNIPPRQTHPAGG